MISNLYLLIIIFVIHLVLEKYKKKIFGNYFLDLPDESRKIHKEPTYLIGGHFIFISYSIFLLFSYDYNFNQKIFFFFYFFMYFFNWDLGRFKKFKASS